MLIRLLRARFAPSPTFAQLADEWLTATERRLRPSWHGAARRIIRQDILPLLGTLRADRIERRDVVKAMNRCTERNALAIANHTLALIRIILNWGIASGRLDPQSDPTRGLKKHPVRARERILNESELRAIWHASGDDDHGRIVRLLMITGQRRGEIGGLCWREIEQSLDGLIIALPASRTKNHRSHVVPLTALALAQLPVRRDGREQVFGRPPGRGYSGWSRAKRALDERLGELAPWTLHDLRRSFVTHCAERGIAEPHIIEVCVNHISGHRAGVAGVYNRAAYATAKRAALERWAGRTGADRCHTLNIRCAVGSTSGFTP